MLNEAGSVIDLNEPYGHDLLKLAITTVDHPLPCTWVYTRNPCDWLLLATAIGLQLTYPPDAHSP
jgi:hypothetical protein